ncbi:sensor histidine kinase [Bacillus alkalicellulosilyticus]|uniref:sensor histidine kinase n=1 Tax=Alkalihalobacterium alkalicellulosilyticum TaxID=1912214 RepID=UPI000997D7AF|nr:sensor histidine kinase [Bacillus alkalicellulosilyticus]
MFPKLKHWNTLRNQILIVFVSVMALVLLIASVITYNEVSTLLKENAEKQIQQTAVQASGRMDVLFEQVSKLASQVANHAKVQEILLNHVNGIEPSFRERQSLMHVVNSYVPFSDGIDSFELYLSDERRLFPLNEADLSSRLDPRWIQKADEAKGRMIWISKDPNDPNFYLAIKQVTLLDRWFSQGGYLVVRIKDTYFQFNEASQTSDYMILLDGDVHPISSNFEGDVSLIFSTSGRSVTINESEHLLVEHVSKLTGWKTVILTPISSVTKDVTALRTALIVACIIGFFVFLIFSYSISTAITKPIQKLTKTLKYGTLGALHPNPEISSTKEINELNETYNNMVETMNHLIQVVYEKEILSSRAELKALQAQINPHFLFNTLDVLYWSLDEKGEEELSEYVLDMADLFRYTIQYDKQEDWVLVKEEIDHVERYMKIMKIRFEDRLTWKITVPAEFESVELPKLVIQPLVENAILHGIGNQVGQGHVEVIIKRGKGDFIQVIVKDNGAGMGQRTLESLYQSLKTDTMKLSGKSGMALVNVNKRLKLYYQIKQSYALMIESEKGKGTEVYFEIPWRRQRDEVSESDISR